MFFTITPSWNSAPAVSTVLMIVHLGNNGILVSYTQHSKAYWYTDHGGSRGLAGHDRGPCTLARTTVVLRARGLQWWASRIKTTNDIGLLI